MKKKEYLLIKKWTNRKIKLLKKKINIGKSLKVTNSFLRYLPGAISKNKKNIKEINEDYKLK